MKLNPQKKEFKTWLKSNVRAVDSRTVIELFEYQDQYEYGGSKKCRDKPVLAQKTGVKRGDALKRSQHEIRQRIWANVDDLVKPTFYTFTFARSVDDLKEANSLWAAFVRRLRFVQPDIKYVSVVEFQYERFKKYGRGAWHYHVLFFNLDVGMHRSELLAYAYRQTGDKDAMGDLGKLWQNGFVDCSPTRTRIGAIRSIAAYVAKYLSEDTFDARLSGQKVYFCSRNILLPKQFNEKELVDELLDKKKELEYSSVYTSSRYGEVKYYQFKVL